MNWYIVKNVFQIITGDGHHQPQFEERMVLIQGDSQAHAYEKALISGKNGEENMVNEGGELVSWNFITTAQIHPIEKLSDGTTLCIRTEEPDQSEAYIKWIKEGMLPN